MKIWKISEFWIKISKVGSKFWHWEGYAFETKSPFLPYPKIIQCQQWFFYMSVIRFEILSFINLFSFIFVEHYQVSFCIGPLSLKMQKVWKKKMKNTRNAFPIVLWGNLDYLSDYLLPLSRAPPAQHFYHSSDPNSVPNNRTKVLQGCKLALFQHLCF